MSLNIIVRNRRTQKERTIQERGRAVLASYYRTECEHPEKFGLPGKPTKAEIKKAWSDDAKGDIDPSL